MNGASTATGILGPESSSRSFVWKCPKCTIDRQLLERLGQCIRRYVTDETLMAEAIDSGDPDWLE